MGKILQASIKKYFVLQKGELDPAKFIAGQTELQTLPISWQVGISWSTEHNGDWIPEQVGSDTDAESQLEQAGILNCPELLVISIPDVWYELLFELACSTNIRIVEKITIAIK